MFIPSLFFIFRRSISRSQRYMTAPMAILCYVFCAGLFCPGTGVFAKDSVSKFADGHIHFNWDQTELISAQEVVKILQNAEVDLAIVAGTPSELALALREAGGERIIPFFSPYIHELGKRDWYRNKQVLQIAEQHIRAGRYKGIGEIHFMAGFPPRLDNEVFQQLLRLAAKYELPALIHIDGADESLFLSLCRAHPKNKLIFAHAGGNLKPTHIEAILRQCNNVWVEFSARDPWRYGGLTGKDGSLLPGWEQLLRRFPKRIYTGTDPVWRVTRTQSWDQADDGWDHYGQLIHYHRDWLKRLPADIQQRVRWDNIQDLLYKPLARQP